MVAMVLNLEVADYDEWKKLFDSDPGGRKGIATGHTVSRNVENPNAWGANTRSGEARGLLSRR